MIIVYVLLGKHRMTMQFLVQFAITGSFTIANPLRKILWKEVLGK